MKKHLILFLITGFTLFGATAAIAHGGKEHSHELIQSGQARERAVAAVGKLVESGKVTAEWKTLLPTIQKKTFETATEWVATFENSTASDPDKRKLFVFLSLTGEFLAANHTGN